LSLLVCTVFKRKTPPELTGSSIPKTGNQRSQNQWNGGAQKLAQVDYCRLLDVGVFLVIRLGKKFQNVGDAVIVRFLGEVLACDQRQSQLAAKHDHSFPRLIRARDGGAVAISIALDQACEFIRDRFMNLGAITFEL
jgi:hypothetical protein